jgi:transitional endoplasmic reticulum ATPase
MNIQNCEQIESKTDCSKEFQQSLPTPDPERFDRWAQRLFESNRFQEADAAYTECLRLDPQNVNALFNRGIIKGLLKDKDGALSDLSLVLLQMDVFSYPLLKNNENATKNQNENPPKTCTTPKEDTFTQAQKEFEEINKALEDTLRLICESPSASKHSSGKEDKNKTTESFLGAISQVGYCLPQERLSDVQGLEIAKENLWNNVVLPLLRPDLFNKYNKKRSYSVLLYGPPGCGKTLLVKALAGETDSYIVQAKLHELMDMYIGNSQKNIHALFEGARALTRNNNRTCILFLDELDSVGVNRGLVAKENSGSHRDCVNQLLMELDGVEENPEGLFVVAATNRPWNLDPALRRSGRIGETIYINPPSKDDRRRLFEYYIGDSIKEGIDLEKLANSTEGCSASDIECIVDRAKLRPIKREHETNVEDALTMQDLEEIICDPAYGKGSLGEWFLSVANELSQEPLDGTRYKLLVDDMKRFVKMNSAISVKTLST